MNEGVDICPKGPPGPIAYRGKQIDLSDGPVVMGVLNVTPDSFYDGGRYGEYEQAILYSIKLSWHL